MGDPNHARDDVVNKNFDGFVPDAGGAESDDESSDEEGLSVETIAALGYAVDRFVAIHELALVLDGGEIRRNEERELGSPCGGASVGQGSGGLIDTMIAVGTVFAKGCEEYPGQAVALAMSLTVMGVAWYSGYNPFDFGDDGAAGSGA
jgi:hypothetical protein